MMKSLYFPVKHFQISIMYSRGTCNRCKNIHQSPISVRRRDLTASGISHFLREMLKILLDNSTKIIFKFCVFCLLCLCYQKHNLTYECVSGGQKCYFFGNFAYVLTEWSLKKKLSKKTYIVTMLKVLKFYSPLNT